MKQNLLMKIFAGISGFFLLSFAIPAIAAPGNGTTNSAVVPIQQKPSDLLRGFKRAVCYSGFRHGQHPDRGDGVVNPSDKEILEDLHILSRQGNFGMIRLYDAQANSEAVLRLIETNKLNLKVMLGAWLAAEVDNPNCPWHKEPYPKEVLEANKLKNAKEIESAIRLANQYSNIVVAVAVGNEALVDWNDHMVPVDSVIGYVRKVKKSISQPVTVADNYNWWSHHGAVLAKELDFVSVHTYPVWEGKDVDEAMPYQHRQPASRPECPASQPARHYRGGLGVQRERIRSPRQRGKAKALLSRPVRLD